VVWKPDTADKFNEIDEDNVGFTERQKKIARGRSFELYDRLHLDMWFQEKYLLNGVDIRLRLNRSSAAFHLMSAVDSKTVIQEARLYVRRVEVLPKVGNDISHTLSRTTAKYPIRRVEVKTFTIAAGLRSKIEDHLFQGQLPKRLFIGIVSNAALNGTHDKNPFKFNHYSVS